MNNSFFRFLGSKKAKMSRGLRNSKILLHRCSWIKTRTVLNVCRISATLSSSGSKNFSVSPSTSIQKTQPVETCSKNDGGFPDFREFDIPTLITAIFVIVSFLMILVLFAKALYEYIQDGDGTLKLHGDSQSPKVSFWNKIWDEEESGKKKKSIKGVQSEKPEEITGSNKNNNLENTSDQKDGANEKQKKDADDKWSFWKKKGVKQEDEKNGKDMDEKKVVKQEDEKNGKDNDESSWQWWKTKKEEKSEKEDAPDKEKTADKESANGESKDWFWKSKKDVKPDKDYSETKEQEISRANDINDTKIVTKKDESPQKDDDKNKTESAIKDETSKKDDTSKKDETSKKVETSKKDANPKKDETSKKESSAKKDEKSPKEVENFYKYEDGFVDGYNTTKTSKVSAFVNQVIQLTIVVLTLIF